ncbi:MAG: neutral/alkaline non-lysosomal ceramidase N-terminal domain-containing protein [Verrucomicrobiia bacterium]
MRTLCLSLIIGLIVTSHSAASQPEWRVGTARTDITPSGPIWMGGYASRNHPSEGVLQPIWAKALLFEDPAGSRAAIVTLDLIGIDRGLTDSVCQRICQKTGIPRERIVLNCSHTHSGPVVAGVTPLVYDLDAGQQKTVDDYAKTLADKLVLLVEAAVKDLQPAKLAFGEGQATFGANRRAMRVKVPEGAPKPPAPVDHTVPVLTVRDEKDALRAVLFGYACHSTTLAIYEINGDYPGFAQAALETSHPGVTALFMAGCGADVNPNPRSEVALAKQHGQSLAAAVDTVLGGTLRPLRGPLAVGFERVDLKFVAPPNKEQLEKLLQDKNKYQQRLAKHLLGELAAGRALPTSYPCPVQVLRFGNDLVMVALAGEVCVDYALRLRREFAGRPIMIASFCNEIFSYIPTERVLSEGGYEGGAAMVYFGIHGPFQPGLEQQIIDTVKRLAK